MGNVHEYNPLLALDRLLAECTSRYRDCSLSCFSISFNLCFDINIIAGGKWLSDELTVCSIELMSLLRLYRNDLNSIHSKISTVNIVGLLA